MRTTTSLTPLTVRLLAGVALCGATGPAHQAAAYADGSPQGSPTCDVKGSALIQRRVTMGLQPAQAQQAVLPGDPVSTIEGCSGQTLDDIKALETNLRGMRREGGTDVREYMWEQALVNEVHAKRICQTGFNTGISAMAFLCAAGDTSVYSYDLGEHDYVATQSAYVAKMFPGRHEIVIGDSTKTLPDAIERGGVHPGMLCDLAFVDGGHTYDIALADIRHFANLTKRGGRLLIDDCNSDQVSRGLGWMTPVNQAYQTALRQKIVTHQGQVSTGCGAHFEPTQCREICVARYGPP